MFEEGVASAENIDKAMVLGYGHPIGPLALTDLVDSMSDWRSTSIFIMRLGATHFGRLASSGRWCGQESLDVKLDAGSTIIREALPEFGRNGTHG